MAIEKVGITFVQKGINFAERPSVRRGLSRLKTFFTQGQNYQQYNQIVGTCKRPVIGNIPKELIQIIAKTNPNNKAETIKRVQNVFAETADRLKGCQKVQLDSIKNISGRESEIEFLYKMLMRGEHMKLAQSEEEAEIVKSAAEHMEICLQPLFKDGIKVQIDYVNEGCFKNCFKLQIFDKNGKKLMHNRALNVYKDGDLSGEIVEAKYKKALELLHKYTDQEIRQWMDSKNIREQNLFKINTRRALLKRCIPEEEGYDQTRFMFDKAYCHGANAEANSIARLKHVLGHDLSRSNAVNTDMFDLRTGFQIEQFSDSALPKITHEIDFNKLGLSAEDLHPNNFVEGRIVDFGSIKTNNGLLEDDVVLSWFKKIMNRINPKERKEVLERYKKLVENPKMPFRDKIQRAISLAELRIAKEEQLNALINN